MWAFVKRNSLLFFRNRAGVFFSVLGALIAFLLYLVFLKKSMSTSRKIAGSVVNWRHLNHHRCHDHTKWSRADDC